MYIQLVLTIPVLFTGASICNFGLKVYGKSGPSKASNVAVVPLKAPTFAVVEKKDDDEGGPGLTEIAEIAFGTVGALVTLVTTFGSIFACKKCKGNENKDTEPGTDEPESENKPGMLLRKDTK